MNDLADVYVKIPINLVNEWRNYFWYATNPSSSALPVFKVVVGDGNHIINGQWVEKGQPLKAIKGYEVNIRSPITGLVKDSYPNGIIIQPKKNFRFQENVGDIMFREIVNFGHRIEREIKEYDSKTLFGKLLFDWKNGSSPWNEVRSRRESPKDLLKNLDKLLEAKCELISKIN